LAQRTGVFLLSGPATDAVRMVSVVASAPADHAALTVRYLVSLTLETGLIDAVLANGTVLNRHIPTPQRNGVPLFHFNTLIDLHATTYYKNVNYKVRRIQINVMCS